MFISDNNYCYLYGILIVIGYWVDILNARPSTKDISTINPISSNVSSSSSSSAIIVKKSFTNLKNSSNDDDADKESTYNTSTSSTVLPRILFQTSSGISSESLIDFEDFNTDTQDIIFPDSYETDDTDDILDDNDDNNDDRRYILNERPNCKIEDTYCEKAPSYPYRQLKKLLEKTDVPKIFFGVDEAPDEITNRLGEQEENYICQSIERTIYPQIGKTKNQKWKYIVNQGESGYVQGVKIEICKNKEGPCDLIRNYLPNGYVTSCKQKYVYRRLLSIADEGKKTVKETFQMPSACCCSYRKNPYFLMNYGNPISPIFGRKNKYN